MSTLPAQEPVDPALVQTAAAELPGLEEMLAEFTSTSSVHRPSAQWNHLLVRNLSQIADRGFGAFKETVNTNYFQFEPGSPFGKGVRVPISRRIVREWLKRPVPRVAGARLAAPERSVHDGMDARWHAWLVAALWEVSRRSDAFGLLDRLEEPELGSGPAVTYRGRQISEDLANSVAELSTVAEALGPDRMPEGTVVEIGAGYGRFAWLYLSAFPQTRYVVCDIPPALAISQRYLTTLFPDRPAFRFRHFGDPTAVADEIGRSKLVFLMPHQLELLAPLEADLFVNISSLHEMSTEQIEAHFGQIDRHTRTGGSFYTKQWARFANTFDDIVVEKDGYPVRANWRLRLDRYPPVPPGFFESVYEIG